MASQFEGGEFAEHWSTGRVSDGFSHWACFFRLGASVLQRRSGRAQLHGVRNSFRKYPIHAVRGLM